MPTTIQVREVTKQRLDLLKTKMKASTYDEIVSKLAGEKLGGPTTLFGAYRDLKPWTKADRGTQNMAECLLDSSAWIEYLKGSEQGSYVCGLVEEKMAATCVLSLAEVDSKFSAEKKDSAAATAFMQRETPILPVLPSVAARSGAFRNERRKTHPSFSLIDSILLLTAQEYGFTLVTKDKDLEGLPGVELL